MIRVYSYHLSKLIKLLQEINSDIVHLFCIFSYLFANVIIIVVKVLNITVTFIFTYLIVIIIVVRTSTLKLLLHNEFISILNINIFNNFFLFFITIMTGTIVTPSAAFTMFKIGRA